MKSTEMFKLSGIYVDCFLDCHPLTTHAHLLGTTYPADTPKCEKCGKAAPRSEKDGCFKIQGAEVCGECFEKSIKEQQTATTADGVMEQLTAITAERDKLRDELDALKAKTTQPQRIDFIDPFPFHVMLCGGEKVLVPRSKNGAGDVPAWVPKMQYQDQSPPTQPIQFQPFQRVLVRDKDAGRWTTALYGYPNADSDGRHKCCGGIWRYVLPYEGNEHLLGTTESPK